MKKSLLALFCAIGAVFFNSAYANEVTVYNPQPGEPYPTTTYLPIALNTSGTNCGRFSVSQQLYYASELSTASSKTITAITFYYTSGTSFTRNLQVWMQNTELDNFQLRESPYQGTPYMVDPGIEVFSGDVTLTDGQPYTIPFVTSFTWDGESNIIVTVLDNTGLKNNNRTDYPDISTFYPGNHSMFATPGAIRFLHKTYTGDSKNFADAGWTMENMTSAVANNSSEGNRKYVNKITFTFAAAAVAPATPDDLAVSATTASSATLAWSAVEGATSYDLQQSADGESWSTLSTVETGTSYNWTGLDAESTQYARIRATNANGSSTWSSAVTVVTDAVHSHNGISFDKWSSTSSMPTSGNYYLNDDVALDPFEPTTITLTGNLNLCLNGNTANLYGTKIVVPDDITFTIYDNVGGGILTGFVESNVGASENYATSLIVVKSGGELVLKQGTIENTYMHDSEDPSDGWSYAIYSNGSVHLSGNVLINSNNVDIYLYSSNIITLDGAISNAEKHTVYKNGGDFTDGWSTYMSGENPRDYFESANSARSVYLNEDEASLRLLLNLSESSLNSSIGTSSGQVADVNLTRSLTSSQYNTFCLPFALSNAQMEEFFGEDYDLEEFVSSSLEDDILSLTFNKVTTGLVAGKPYLLQPSIDVVNPSFEGVTIAETSPVYQTSDTYIAFHGTYAPTELTGGNKNLLFLGADNELFWPESTGNIKGFRAYFEVKGSAAKAAKKARIVKKEDSATGIDQITNDKSPMTNKIIKDNQLLILRGNKTYNVIGQMVK